MDCGRFQETISDYIDGTLDVRARTEHSAHRLLCRECREIYDDVRGTMSALDELATRPMPAPAALEDRILAATTTGVMLNCYEFDRLLERYFDGVILAPTYQTFQSHFEQCNKCRRLMRSIEDAIDLCHAVKDSEVEVPSELCDRIVAATSGSSRSRQFFALTASAKQAFFRNLSYVLSTELATAALIFVALFTLTMLRFGSLRELASHAEAKAGRMVQESQDAFSETGVMALTGIQIVSQEVSTLIRGNQNGNQKSNSTADSTVNGTQAVPTPTAAPVERSRGASQQSGAQKTKTSQ